MPSILIEDEIDLPSLRIVSKVVGKKTKPKAESKPQNSSKSETPETSPSSIKVGNKVKFPLSNKTSSGIVRFLGPTKFSSGVWCGIELSKPEGRNNGTVKGVKYFDCKFNYGIFIQADKVVPFDGSLKGDGKQEKTLSRVSSLVKKKSKSIDTAPPGLEVKQLDTSIGDDWVVFEGSDDKKCVTKDADVVNTKIEEANSSEELIDADSDSDQNMKRVITKEINIADTPMKIKIAENVNNDDNNNTPNESPKTADHGLMFFVTGHQRPVLSQKPPRPKSCPTLASVLDGNTSIEEVEKKLKSLGESDDSSDVEMSDIPKQTSTLKRRLSGIEKRIRGSQMRSPSPGMLRKAFSHGTVFPKENYVAFDDDFQRPKFTRPLERSLSDVTLYQRVRSPSGRFPKTPPLLRKPWLRREKTAPEFKKDRNVNDEDDEFSTDVSDEDVIIEKEDAEMLSECQEINGSVESIPKLDYSNESDGSSRENAKDKQEDVNELDNLRRDELGGKEEVKEISKTKVTSRPLLKGLPIFTKSITSKTTRKTSVPAKLQQKTSLPVSNLTTTKQSHSELDVSKPVSIFSNGFVKSANKCQDKVRPPQKLNKRVSDMVATFEKSNSLDGDKMDSKECQTKTAVKLGMVGKVSSKLNQSKPESNEKDSKKCIPVHVKRKSSQVNKEELAAKETLSQQYVEKETSKVGSPARTSLSGTTSTPRSSSSSSTPRSNASVSKTPRSSVSTAPKDVKAKTVETPRRTSIPVKSPGTKVNKSGGSPAHLQSREDDKKKIRELKAKCENCENQINLMREDLKEKNLGMEAFIIVIRQHIQTIEESSRKQQLLKEERDRLHSELGETESFIESSKQQLTSAQEKLERSSRDFKTQIESLKKVHALEKDDVKRQLKEEQEKEIQKVKNSLKSEIADLKENHEEEINLLKDEYDELTKDNVEEHNKILKSKEEHYSKTVKEIESQFQTEKEEVCLDYEDRLQDVQNQLESVQERCYEFEVKNAKLQEELDKDIETRMQALAKYNNLPAELESLQTVIELKNEEIKKTRTQNMELQKKVEDMYELERKFAKVFQEKEALSVALQNKSKCERQLSVERESLAANLEKEARKVKRLSMEKEELMWKYANTSSLSLSSPSLNIDSPVSPNGFESTPNTSRSFSRSLKSQSLYLPTLDDEEYTVL